MLYDSGTPGLYFGLMDEGRKGIGESIRESRIYEPFGNKTHDLSNYIVDWGDVLVISDNILNMFSEIEWDVNVNKISVTSLKTISSEVFKSIYSYKIILLDIDINEINKETLNLLMNNFKNINSICRNNHPLVIVLDSNKIRCDIVDEYGMKQAQEYSNQDIVDMLIPLGKDSIISNPIYSEQILEEYEDDITILARIEHIFYRYIYFDLFGKDTAKNNILKYGPYKFRNQRLISYAGYNSYFKWMYFPKPIKLFALQDVDEIVNGLRKLLTYCIYYSNNIIGSSGGKKTINTDLKNKSCNNAYHNKFESECDPQSQKSSVIQSIEDNQDIGIGVKKTWPPFFQTNEINIIKYKNEHKNRCSLINDVFVKNSICIEKVNSITQEQLTKVFNELIHIPNLLQLLAQNKGLLEASDLAADTKTIIINKHKLAEIYPITLRKSKKEYIDTIFFDADFNLHLNYNKIAILSNERTKTKIKRKELFEALGECPGKALGTNYILDDLFAHIYRKRHEQGIKWLYHIVSTLNNAMRPHKIYSNDLIMGSPDPRYGYALLANVVECSEGWDDYLDID